MPPGHHLSSPTGRSGSTPQLFEPKPAEPGLALEGVLTHALAGKAPPTGSGALPDQGCLLLQSPVPPRLSSLKRGPSPRNWKQKCWPHHAGTPITQGPSIVRYLPYHQGVGFTEYESFGHVFHNLA